MENHKETCGGNMCCSTQMACGHQTMKHLIKLVILVLVFCLGYEMGKIKGMLHSSYGHHGFYGTSMMEDGGNDGWDNTGDMGPGQMMPQIDGGLQKAN